MRVRTSEVCLAGLRTRHIEVVAKFREEQGIICPLGGRRLLPAMDESRFVRRQCPEPRRNMMENLLLLLDHRCGLMAPFEMLNTGHQGSLTVASLRYLGASLSLSILSTSHRRRRAAPVSWLTLDRIYFSRTFRFRLTALQAHRKDSGFNRGAAYSQESQDGQLKHARSSL